MATATLSDRVLQLKTSSTLAVTGKARALKAQNIDVVSFAAGEPDFDTPKHIVEAGCEALKQGKTRYEDTAGTPQARQAVADYFNSRFGLNYAVQNVHISTGAKHAIFLTFMALVNPGDEVLLPSPYWVTYPEQAKLAGATVKVVPGSVDNDFKITPEQLEKAITPKTKVFLLCSPSNPTGTSYTGQELKALADVLLRHPGIYIIADEIYERLVYGDNKFTAFASLSKELAPRVISINGVSKAYAMTGWRVGYAVGDETIIKAITKLQGQMTSNITACTMPALVAALNGPQEPVSAMVAEFEKRAQHIHQRMSSIPNVKCPKPTGAFYIFPDISKAAFGKKDKQGNVINTAQQFAVSLLDNYQVAVVPGEDFGGPNHIRLSFACSMEQIDKGMDRIEKFMSELH